jgi:hypothetical protein
VGKAHAHRECNTKYDVERDHLRRCQSIRYVRAENASGQDDVHNHRQRRDGERRHQQPQSAHSARESCEKQRPPEAQHSVREHPDDSHYYMKTPDAVRSVTKKETRDCVEGARGHSLLNTEAEERTGGRSRGECPRQDALGERRLLEETGAHGTKETRRRNALKPCAGR